MCNNYVTIIVDSMVNKMKVKQFIVVLTLSVLILSGCQMAPNEQSVISKNDGYFESSLVATQAEDETIPTQMMVDEHFTSTDGTVQFHLNIDQSIAAPKMPAVEVEPCSITSQDIERVAKVLLGDVVFYEKESSSNPQYSKSQYQEMITRLAPYANMEAMTDLVGEDQAEDMLDSVKQIIDYITNAMENAPEENPHTLCDWTLKKERVYNDSTVDIGERALGEDDDWLVATAEKDGMGYTYMVIARDQEDYKLNRFILQLGGASIDTYTDRLIYWAELCRTEYPTQEQIQAARDKVIDLLADMQFGEWQIVLCEVENVSMAEEPEYILRIRAMPKLNGVPAISGQESISKSDDYTGAYALTQATFLMSANGEIINMELDSPIKVKSVLNENVKVLAFDQLIERMKQHLSLSDATTFAMDTFGVSTTRLEELEQQFGEDLVCHVEITELEYGLGRVMVKNSTDSYYYVPVLILRGKANFVGADTGNTYLYGYLKTMLNMNAVDGSIIG